MPLGTARRDQARQILKLLRILIDKLECDLQPFAVDLGLHGRDAMHIHVHARDRLVCILLQIQHATFKYLR